MKILFLLSVFLFHGFKMAVAQPGKLDFSFGTKGVVRADSGVYTSTAIQSDGKVLVAGYNWNGTNYDFAATRYKINGSVDSTFSSDGTQTTDFGLDDYARCLAIQSNGKVLIACTALVRYNPDGSPDNTFDTDGKQTTDFDISSVQIQKDGKIVVAGGQWLARYNSNGSPDSTFSGDGKQNIPFNPFSAKSIAIQNDGKIVVVGDQFIYPPRGFIILRYNTDGSLDPTFDGDGIQTTDFFPGFDYDNALFTVPAAGATSVCIKSDGKIIVGGYAGYYQRYRYEWDLAIASYNTDGSLDKAFSGDGMNIIQFNSYAIDCSIALQDNNNIILKGILYFDPGQDGEEDDQPVTLGSAFARVNADGNLDSNFGTAGFQYVETDDEIQGIAIWKDKLYAAGYLKDTAYLARYLLQENKAPVITITTPANNATYTAGASIIIHTAVTDIDGVISKVKLYNGGILLNTDSISPYTYTLNNAVAGNYSFIAKATDNNGLTSSSSSVAISVSTTSNKAPTVNITSPLTNAVYIAPATITIKANATDEDGVVRNVKFYSGGTLLHTDNTSPYTYTLTNVAAGRYSFIAKATDNKGSFNSSASVSVLVMANKPPAVSIINPANGAGFTAPATINFEAAAQDPDGKITNVTFYSGTTLLVTERKPPYTYQWLNAPPGYYTITAKATDNLGAVTTSAAVMITVTAPEAIVSNRPAALNNKKNLTGTISLQLAPNPAKGIVNIYTSGLQKDKLTTLSIISPSGVIIKTTKIASSNQPITQDVSSLVGGFYTIKIVNGDEVVYKKLVKL